MTLAPGSRLGEYEIRAVLGEGGMGAVYRARDHRLKRDVAIKILTGGGIHDPEAARRLLEEARHAARLNHPHICVIHEVAELEGVPFIVMEHVEGRLLSDVIAAGALPLEAAVRCGTQIADALAHAHDRGIVHRDLKPANVLVTPDGRVKVLDFGIAAAVDAREDDQSTEAVTLGSGASGTLAYMPPEALHGEPAGVSGDIWALGVVLYEMTTGRRPFTGKTAAATASAILHGALPPLPAEVPAALGRIIQRCLERAPGARYQRASEVRAALDVAGETAGRSAVSIPTRHALESARTRWPIARVGLWSVIAAIAIVLALWARAALLTKPHTFAVSDQRAIAAFGDAYREATLSPDGFIAFVESGKAVPQIWVKNLAQGPPIQITSGDVPASHPAWSPKNDQIVFARRGQGLWSVPPLGGTARRLLDFGLNPSFSSDGERLVFERARREIWTSRADGSDARRVAGVPTPWYSTGLYPAFSPDGASIVYVLSQIGPNGDLWIVPATGGTPRQLTFDLTDVTHPVWTPDGRFIVFSSMRGGSRTLWRVSPRGGAPEPVTVGAGEDIEPAFSRDGRTLVYTNVRNQWRLAAFDPATGRERVIVERRRETVWPRVSPDGSKVVFFGFADQGDVQIFVVPLGGGTVEQVTHGRGQLNSMPRWSPDGSTIYYYEQRPNSRLRSVAASGGESRDVKPWMWESHTYAEFSPDGKQITYLGQSAPGGPAVKPATIVHDIQSGTERTLPLAMLPARWSPDGRLLLGATTPAPTVIATCPADGSACRRLTNGGFPVWSRDGSRIYFMRDTSDPAIKELWSMTADGRDEKKLFDRLGPFRGIDTTFDVAPTGEIVWNQYIEGKHELWQATIR